MNVERQEKKAKIDEGLYSRQLYVLGHEAQMKITTSKILIIGLGSLGVEVAKNVVLAGLKEVCIHDESICSEADMSSNFYVSKSNLGSTRADACFGKLSELNSYVRLSQHKDIIDSTDKEFLSKFTCVCVTDLPSYAKLDWILSLGDTCHALNVKFITGRSAGLFCYAFCDFGKNFLVADKDGEVPSDCLVSAMQVEEKDGKYLLNVTVHDESRHDLETKDVVKFDELKGDYMNMNKKEYKITVTGPFNFTIELPPEISRSAVFKGGGHMTQVKQKFELNFLPLRKCLQEPGDLLITDFAKFSRPKVLHALFQALQIYSDSHGGTLPCESNLSTDQLEELFEYTQKIFGESQEVGEIEMRKLVYSFGVGCAAQLAPITSFLGGVIAQEILKACSHKFTPLKQFLYFDAVECLPYWDTQNPRKGWDAFISGLEKVSKQRDNSSAEARVFGTEFSKKLAKQKMFLVGAGAIGCEMLKNWALMGVASDGGSITVTDMDMIERSNLNRQFLFRDGDVGSNKAAAAAKAVKLINPLTKVIPMEDRVGEDTEHIFGDEFMQGLDIVTTALDNIKARLYVDGRCLQYQKPLLESGTLGTKGNTQVVVPFLTENYGASRDPPAKEVPICTLKNFPYRIEHTLQWARELFETEFDVNADTVNMFLKAPDMNGLLKSSQFTSMNENTKVSKLQEICKSLGEEKPQNLVDCVAWARHKFEVLFANQIKQLLHNFPPGTVTSSGALFWSGTKREPVPVEFNPNDETHLGFVVSAASLRAFNFGIEPVKDSKEVLKILDSIIVPEFVPKKVKIAVTDEELKNTNDVEVTDLDTIVEQLVLKIDNLVMKDQKLKKQGLFVAEFEKDDDSNFHMDFITAASNLRARNYAIDEVDKHKAKLIAGKIIPAIATTTALVTGLICLEMYKLVGGKSDVESYKNGFVNLALPLFAFSEPIKVEKFKAGAFEFCIWDRLELDGRKDPMTLEAFVNHFEAKFNVEVSMITFGHLVLYSSFLSQAKRTQRMQLEMKAVAELVAKKKFDPSLKSIEFELCCTDENDEDVDIPAIQYKI